MDLLEQVEILPPLCFAREVPQSADRGQEQQTWESIICEAEGGSLVSGGGFVQVDRWRQDHLWGILVVWRDNDATVDSLGKNFNF